MHTTSGALAAAVFVLLVTTAATVGRFAGALADNRPLETPVAASAAAPSDAPGAAASAPAAPAGAGVPPDARAYLDQTMPRIELAGDMIGRLVKQSELVGANPGLISDPQWRDETALIVGGLKSTGEELRSGSNVPPSVAALDRTIAAIGHDLVGLADDYTRATEAGNPERLDEASSRMRSLSARASEAAEQLKGLATF